MKSHLREITDIAVRDGIFAFETEMELMVLSFLDHDRAVALAQIEAARDTLFDHLADWDSGNLSGADRARSARLANAMLTRTFERLRLALASPSGNGSRAKPGNSN